MSPETSFQLKVANEEWEFEAIHRLNHRTFVEEIPQHPPSADGRLVDRFHGENDYVIALHERRLVGMLAFRGRRPFSLDAKIPNLDGHLPAARKPVEARLLAVEPGFRRTILFVALFDCAVQFCREAGYDLVLISGTTRQLKLYRHLGFTAFGPLVGTAAALYQPMYLTLEEFGRATRHSRALGHNSPNEDEALNLLPGPVLIAPEVKAAFAAPPVSHRSPAFLAQMQRLRQRLCDLTGARQVQILPGSGSLANAVVAAQLSLEPGPGLVLANGEFGERLAGDARRARLQFDALQLPWGLPFDLAQVEAIAARLSPGGWIWFVHHETSTGMLNPLPQLKAIADRRGLRLCADCISSIGAQPVNLRGLYLATGTSGKGLGSHPGLALVFHDHEPRSRPAQLPGYLDLGHWAEHDSVPHTHSSNLVGALETAVRAATPDRMDRIRDNACWLRDALAAIGLPALVPSETASPGVITLALENRTDVAALGTALEESGFLLNFRSAHLLARNWIQISLLGDPPRAGLAKLVDLLRTLRSGKALPPPMRSRSRSRFEGKTGSIPLRTFAAS